MANNPTNQASSGETSHKNVTGGKMEIMLIVLLPAIIGGILGGLVGTFLAFWMNVILVTVAVIIVRDVWVKSQHITKMLGAIVVGGFLTAFSLSATLASVYYLFTGCLDGMQTLADPLSRLLLRH